jgi:hypothetical protein
MPDLRFEVEFDDCPDETQLPEDCTIADLAIAVGDDYLTYHQKRDRIAEGGKRFGKSVHGPVAGLVEWLIENWSSILWETQTPFKRSSQYGIPQGRPFVPGYKEAFDQWRQYVQELEFEEDYDYDTASPDFGRIADWQHRHLLGHASSDLAIPSIVIVPEDQIVILCVDRPPGRTFFCGPDRTKRTPTHYFINKADFREAATEFIEIVIKRIHTFDKNRQWAEWVSRRWQDAQDQERSPQGQLQMMIGRVGAERVEALRRAHPAVAAGLRQLLLDCQIVAKDSVLIPVEEVLKQCIGENEKHKYSDEIFGWESIKHGSIGLDQPEFLQGYNLAKQVRKQMRLGTRPIANLVGTLEKLDVTVEKDRTIPLFRAAACAIKGKPAHIIPSVSDPRMELPAPHNFAVASALGRLVWETRTPDERTICVAQGDYSLLSQSRRANAFAAEFLLPSQRVAGLNPEGEELKAVAYEFGISLEAAAWHARNVQAGAFGASG